MKYAGALATVGLLAGESVAFTVAPSSRSVFGGKAIAQQSRATNPVRRMNSQILKAVTKTPGGATPNPPPKSLDKLANEARGLALDGIHAAHSGHLGLPLGCAEIGAVLWATDEGLSYYPGDPQWVNRDRFILSAGHGSMFLYAWLHLSGYDLPIDELKRFRQHKSMTPGHPEFPSSHHNTPGIEATTGPLGTGLANAAGTAAAQKMAEANFNTPEHKIFDSHTIALCGDGCMQEGVSAESAAFAAHEGLDNLIIIYDSNDVTLDKMAEFTHSEDVGARYRAYGWDVVQVDGHNEDQVKKELDHAKKNDNGKPTLIIAKTIIGKGMAEIEGTTAAHGEAGVKYVKESRKAMGLPEDLFHVSEDSQEFFRDRKKQLKEKYDQWQDTFKAWQEANPELAADLDKRIKKQYPTPEEIFAATPEFPADKAIATREAGAVAIQSVAKVVPNYISGSADLHGSNKNYIKGAGDFGRNHGKSYKGRNVYFGIREHAMGAILNGIAYHGLFQASGATFLVFADYMRAPIRIAALSELGAVSYILTHDSIGVGEDGPTHQPVETVSGLRVIPNLDVIRPADPEETVGAYAASVTRKDGPTALILTRQNVPNLSEVPVKTRREGVLKGGYIAKKETGDLKLVLLAAGSEVSVAFAAAKELGEGVRVVSIPSFLRFDKQSESYRNDVLGPKDVKRVAIEAGVSGLWYKYVGLEGAVVGVDKFGMSAPGDIVFKEYGITPENLVSVAKKYL